ncbi:MAG: CDP-diacylglycerol--glycerol-3-phosphate 3-phosphatidyltransferase [Acidobacteria bacterium]|nr:CDP-diacylglycerol--glycerol-3-phosphate 3-phosphatidyltransferase [Acidobacteriota bacterium]
MSAADRPPTPSSGVRRAVVRDALRPLTIPNGITLVRLALTPFFVLAVLEGNARLALVLFAVASVSDLFDGLIARTLGMRSQFGAYLDPIADKVLLVTAYVVLTWPGLPEVKIPLWLTVLALSRDILIVVLSLVMYLAADVRDFRPTLLGKTTTFSHVVTLFLVLVANVEHVPEPVVLATFYVALALTLASGAHYMWRSATMLERLHDVGPSRGGEP